MKNLMRSILYDLYITFSRPFVYVVIALTYALYMVSAAAEIGITRYSEYSVVYYFQAINSFNSLMDILLILATFPPALNFHYEQRTKHHVLAIMRINSSAYFWSKVITCFISTLLSIFAGIFIFIVTLSFKFPLILQNDIHLTGDVLFFLIEAQRPWAYLFGMCLIKAVSMAFWSVFALYCSSYLKDIYYTLLSPLIGYRIYASLYFMLRLPAFCGIQFLGEGLVDLGNPYFSTAYIGVVFIVLSIGCGLLYVNKTRKELANA